MTRTIIGILLSFVLFGCGSDPEPSNSDNQVDQNIKENDKQELITEESNTSEPIIKNEDGPPFSDSCTCRFDYIAEFRYNDHRYDLILSGKEWNPEYWSCTYSFGELISNEFPPDSLITDFRIHLVNIEKFDTKMDSILFESEYFQNNLIATQRLWPGDEYTKCKFDPNKTGKYPKPEQWIE